MLPSSEKDTVPSKLQQPQPHDRAVEDRQVGGRLEPGSRSAPLRPSDRSAPLSAGAIAICSMTAAWALPWSSAW